MRAYVNPEIQSYFLKYILYANFDCIQIKFTYEDPEQVRRKMNKFEKPLYALLRPKTVKFQLKIGLSVNVPIKNAMASVWITSHVPDKPSEPGTSAPALKIYHVLK